MPTVLLCASHYPAVIVSPVCNGVINIAIGEKRTELAYYSQTKVGLVSRLIVDGN